MKIYYTLFCSLLFCITTVFAQAPSNDECVNAIEITLGVNSCSNPVNGTTENATLSNTLPSPSCDNTGNYHDDDVWYKFTATQSGIANFEFSNITGLNTYAYLSAVLYSGTDCNNLTEVSCSYYAPYLSTAHLTQGTTYYFRVYTYSNNPGEFKSFTLCAYMVNNDECINAKELIVGTIPDREYNVLYATTDGATQSGTTPLPSCSVDGYNDDVWYKFTAAVSGNMHVRLQSFGYISAQVYSGSCGSLTALDCKAGSYYKPFFININAVAGTTYYVRVYSTDPAPAVSYDFYITAYTLTPVPGNDDCDNASIMTLGELTCQGSSYGTTLGATHSTNTPDPSCDATGTDDDIWFKFTATHAGIVRFELQNSGYSGNNGGITAQLYSGSCNGLVPVSCNSFSGYNYGGSFSFQATVADATDYYLRIYTPENDPANFAIVNTCAYYLPPPPANDECEGAVELTPDPSSLCNASTAGTTIGATSSSIPGCYGVNVDDDVWYKFIATAETHKITVTPEEINGLGNYTAFQVFSGSCGTLTEMVCAVGVEAPGPAQQVLGGLSIGETYYVRVYSLWDDYTAKGDFNICISTPNDDCSTAEMLTVNPTAVCTTVTNGSTTGATQSPEYNYGCGGTDDDVWYKFVATSNAHYITITPAAVNGIDNVLFQVYSGDCASLNQLACINNTAGADPETASVGNLTAGNTYYLRVYSYDPYYGKGDFTVCITTTNDECDDAITLTVNPDNNCTVITNGTTTGATPSQLYTCLGTLPNDVWYTFTTTASTQKITVTPTSTNGISDAAFEIFSGDCNSFSQVSCVNNTTGSDPEETYLTYVGIGSTFYVRVFSNDANAAAGDFNICVSSVLNDNCNDAILLTVNPDNNCVETTHGSTVSTGAYSPASCTGDADDDVWYVFNAPYNSLHINLTPSATNGINNAVMEVYEGYCGSNLLQCVNNTTGTDPENVNLNGLVTGQWYSVRVFSYDTNAGSGDFDLCVSTIATAPSNDECTGAIPLTVSTDYNCTNPVNGTTLFATQSMPGCNGTGADDDVWYSFVALGSSQRITVTQGAFNSIYNPMMEVFTGNCGSLTSIGCYSNFSPYGFFYNIATIPGTTYYVRIYSAANGSGQGDFTICATSYNPVNDDCVGAVDVPVNTDNTCTLSTNGTTVNASASGPYSGCMYGPPDDDVWYKFTAAAHAQLITITPAVTGGINDAVVEVYDGTCTTYMGYLGCANFTTGNAPESITAEGLTIGTVYYFRVYSAANYSGQGAFNVCIKNTVLNDDCVGAITIPVNNDATCTNTYQGTNVGASQSQLAYNTCNQSSDVWYKFVAGANAYEVNITPTATGGIVGPGWGLFSGDCNSLNRLGCTSSAATFENLVIGNTYYLQVSSLNYNPQYRGAFVICVKSINPALPNDICSGAVNVPVGNDITCVATVTGTTTGAGISLTSGLKDVWYKFTATTTAHKIKVSPTADSLRNVAFEVYSGNCGSLLSIAYADIHNDVGFSAPDTIKPEIQSVENLIPGNTYYVRVFSGGVLRHGTIVDPSGSFNICVSLSGNDVCTLARTIIVNAGTGCSETIIDSTENSTLPLNLNLSNTCNTYNAVNDSWFIFTALDTAELITIANISGYYGGAQLLSGDCASLISIACINGGFSRQVFGGLTIGQKYFLRVYSSINSTRAKFSICISHVAVNDECKEAFDVPVNAAPGCAVVTNGSTRGSTPSVAGGNCYNFYSYSYNSAPSPLFGNDVWYKFTATATQHKVTVTGVSPDLNMFVTIYSGDCNSLSQMVCVNDYTPAIGSTDEEAVALDNLIIGNTYFIRVYNQAGAYTVGDFTVCVGPVDPLNDLCSNAVTVPVNSSSSCTLSVTGTNVEATRSYDVGYIYNDGQYGCYTNGNADVFYKFTATAARHLITVTPTASGGIDDVVFYVYSGTCGNLSYVTSVDESVGNAAELRTLDNLVIGGTYYIQVYNSSGAYATRGSYTVCVSAPLINDACTGAIALAVNTTSNCALQATGTTVGATPGSGLQDVWYKFVATAPEHEITVTGITLANPSFTLYKGDCANLVAVREEIDYNANGTGMEFQSFDSLVVGNTYYIQVRSSPPGYSACPKYGYYGLTGTFSICVSAPTLLNDLIDEAINVPINIGTTCSTVVTGTNVGSSFSNNYSECYRTHMNFNPAVSDVWYKFTAVSTSHIITVSPTETGSISEINFSVFERLSPGAGGMRQRGCVNFYGGNAAETQSFNGLIIGKTYYIRVMGSVFTNTQGSFTVCITTPVLPPDNSRIITFAGGGSGDGVSVDNSNLYNPTAIAVDGMGNVYFADSALIKKINKADGIVSIVAGTGVSGFSGDNGPAMLAQISTSSKVAADNDGNIFIGDYDRSQGRIRKVDANGIITTIVNLPQDYFPPPPGCDFCNGSFHVRTITGITTDAAGNVYFTVNRDEDHYGALWQWCNVYKLTPLGTMTELANTGQFGYGTTVDAAGNVYFILDVFDPFYNFVSYRYIKKIDAVTLVNTTVGGTEYFGYTGDGGAAINANMKPYDVKADAAGNLYIADGNGYWNGKEYGNYSIRKISTDGTISTIAGTSVNSYSGDNGPSTQAAMHTPVSIAVDSAMNIYIADVKDNEYPVTTDNRIRKIISNCSGGIAMSNMGNSYYVNTEKIIYKDCDTIAKVVAVSPAVFNKDITAKVWIEPTVPLYNNLPYVARHYEITPLTDPASTNTRITLYFTQQEFSDYNTAMGAGNLLPVDGADVDNNKAHLLIIQYDGVSSNGTGLPGTYTGATTTINPDDNDISWNSTQNRWEVTFTAAGSNGFIIQTASLLTTLNLKLYIQGYYQNVGSLTPMDNFGNGGALYINGLSANANDADNVSVSLMSTLNGSLVESQTGILHTDGSLSVQFAGSRVGNTYWLRITHRNALETWSGAAVTLAATTPYDFSTAATQAYGSNMIEVETGVWALYSGDIIDADTNTPGVQDGVIESSDYSQMENDVYQTLLGYVPSDITGDGVVESSDYSIMENNVYQVILVARPF